MTKPITIKGVTLKRGEVYRVKFRYVDPRESRSGLHTCRRMYLGHEERFGDIPCEVFSTVLRKNTVPAGEISIPHYCILDIQPADKGGD